MRCGLMYGGYGTAWWAHHAVGLLLPHSLLPSRIPSQQTTPVAECSPMYHEPTSPARASSPKRSTPERTQFASKLKLINLFIFILLTVCIINKL